jgi:hypothetical protein
VAEVALMAVPFSRMQELVDQRVRMVFRDQKGTQELIATLLFATEDMDGSQHLIYDKVEWTSVPPAFVSAKDSAFHTEGELLVSIEAAPERGPEPSYTEDATVGGGGHDVESYGSSTTRSKIPAQRL